MMLLWPTTRCRPHNNTRRPIDLPHTEPSTEHIRNTERMADNADPKIGRCFINLFAVGFKETDTPFCRDLLPIETRPIDRKSTERTIDRTIDQTYRAIDRAQTERSKYSYSNFLQSFSRRRTRSVTVTCNRSNTEQSTEPRPNEISTERNIDRTIDQTSSTIPNDRPNADGIERYNVHVSFNLPLRSWGRGSGHPPSPWPPCP